MSQQPEPQVIGEQETEAIIERMRRGELSDQDKTIIAKVLRSYLYLAQMVQQTGAKLKTVRQFLFGQLSKKKRKRLEGAREHRRG